MGWQVWISDGSRQEWVLLVLGSAVWLRELLPISAPVCPKLLRKLLLSPNNPCLEHSRYLHLQSKLPLWQLWSGNSVLFLFSVNTWHTWEISSNVAFRPRQWNGVNPRIQLLQLLLSQQPKIIHILYDGHGWGTISQNASQCPKRSSHRRKGRLSAGNDDNKSSPVYVVVVVTISHKPLRFRFPITKGQSGSRWLIGYSYMRLLCIHPNFTTGPPGWQKEKQPVHLIKSPKG